MRRGRRRGHRRYRRASPRSTTTASWRWSRSTVSPERKRSSLWRATSQIPIGGSAEFAVVVADAWQGRGLGHALMRMLVGCARRRGFRRLVGNVLAANAPMLALVARLGFESRPDPDDREQVIVTLELEKQ